MKGILLSPYKNKLEQEYASYLEQRKMAKEIIWYSYEPIRIKLADNTFYSPDFLVMDRNYNLEVHEVKGWWRDDARVKIKVAASLFPAKFIAITKRKKQWQFEIIGRQ